MSRLFKQFNNEQHLCFTIALTALFRLINHKHIFKWCGFGDVISATMFLGRSWSTVESSSSAAGVVVFHQLAGDPITHIFRRRCCCSDGPIRAALSGAVSLSLCPSRVYWTLYTLGEKETEGGGPGGRSGEHFIKTDITQHG